MRSVEILYFKGCPGFEETRAMVEETLRERGSPLPLRLVEIHDEEEARRAKFLGSPSVRVRGRDIEIFRHNDVRFGFQCRLYRRPDGAWAHAPTKEMLLAALERYS